VDRPGDEPVAVIESVREWAQTKAGQKVTGVSLPPRGRKSTSRTVSGRSDFQAATFEAKLIEAKFMPSGEMKISFTIPESDSDEATLLRTAFSLGLRVRVEKKSGNE
jgi:hypothetical protein